MGLCSEARKQCRKKEKGCSLRPSSSTAAHPLLETLQSGFKTPRCRPAGAQHASPAFSLTLLLPPGRSPTSCLPRTPPRNCGSQNILEVLHHFTVKRFETEPMKKNKTASRKPRLLLPVSCLPPLSTPMSESPGVTRHRSLMYPAPPARKRFMPHSRPGRGVASLPPHLCSPYTSLAVQALVPSHMSPETVFQVHLPLWVSQHR